MSNWGKSEGEQNLEICYLTQMESILKKPGNDSYYGPSESINLSVPGDTTLAGTKRVAQELDIYKGL